MTNEQKQWLDEHPNYSQVRRVGVVAFRNWADEGWLFSNGRFAIDDGNTLFPHAYPAWFVSSDPGVMRVGRHCDIA